jgi:hypothetical protein
MAERTHAENFDHQGNAASALRRWHVALRVLVVIVGGYAAAAALVAGVARVLPITGLARSEAVALASMCGFVFYLALLVWGFSHRHLVRLVFGLALAGGVGLALMFVAGR